MEKVKFPQIFPGAEALNKILFCPLLAFWPSLESLVVTTGVGVTTAT
jgi:hypothetical protein